MEIITNLENWIVIHNITRPRYKELPVRSGRKEVWEVLKRRRRGRSEREGVVNKNEKPACEGVSEGMLSEWSVWRVFKQLSYSICSVRDVSDEREGTENFLLFVEM